MSFWKNRRVFVTGSTGFKGSWLCHTLKFLNADVYGYAIKPENSPNLFESSHLVSQIQQTFDDIRSLDRLKHSIERFQPEVVFHLAAQSTVSRSYKNPLETLTTNIIGTANIIESIRAIESVKSVVIVTSDKCYQWTNTEKRLAESDPIGAGDPYSTSKACADLVSQSFLKSELLAKTTGLSIARSGNVIGGGDWSEKRLIPDLVRSITCSQELILRNPNSSRPWLFIHDIILGYLKLGQRLFEDPETFSGVWNFGPREKETMTVKQVVSNFMDFWSQPITIREVPSDFKENPHLNLDSSKSEIKLNWMPKLGQQNAIESTAKWYKEFYEKNEVKHLVQFDLEKYYSGEI